MYKIIYTAQAARTLHRIPGNVAILIREKVELIAHDPYALHPNTTKLQGRTGYRLRVGDWRVIYEIDNESIMIIIMKNAPRGEVYR